VKFHLLYLMRFDRRLLASRVQGMDPDELLFIVGVPPEELLSYFFMFILRPLNFG